MSGLSSLNQLLRTSASAGIHAPAAPPAGGDAFAQLLQQAQGGSLTGGEPVTVLPRCGVKLNDAQLARVSEVADRAASAGLRKVLVLIDGQALTLDVENRQIVGKVEDNAVGVSDIDGVFSAPPENLLAALGAGSDGAQENAGFAQGLAKLAQAPGSLLAKARAALT